MKRLMTGLLLATAALMMWPGTAQADLARKADPVGDAPPRLDITSVAYTNRANTVSARIEVPGLIRSGGAQLRIATGFGGTDVGYAATVRIRPNGRMATRFDQYNSETSFAVPCAYSAKWTARQNYIRISVPRSCVPLASDGAAYLEASTRSYLDRGESDYAVAAEHLNRG